MHLAEETIQRLVDSELTPSAERDASEHLSLCPECRSRVKDATDEGVWFAQRLHFLDHARPELTAHRIREAHPGTAFRWGRIAAGIVLALALAGVAYAAPGSPLPRLIHQVIEAVSGMPGRSTSAVTSDGGRGSQAGIAVTPGDRFTIEFLQERSRDSVTISLTDGGEVVVRTRGGTTSFTSENDRLVVGRQGDPSTVVILVPRAVPSVEVRVRGRQLWLRENGQIRSELQADSTGHYWLLQ